MKISVTELKKLIDSEVVRESKIKHVKSMQSKLLSEATRLSPTSLDDQIDSLLVSYESAAVEEEDETQMESLSLLDMVSDLLNEAPEDEEKPEEDPKEEPVDEPKGEEIKDDKPDEEDQPAPARVPKINVDEFARRVDRLVTNFDKLLNPKVVILTRARNMIEDNYGKDVADSFEETLRMTHGVEIEPRDDYKPAPFAVGAGPAIPGGGV